MILNRKYAMDCTYLHQTEKTELFSDKSTRDRVIAKREGVSHVRISVDLVVTLETATLSIGHENIVDYVGFIL